MLSTTMMRSGATSRASAALQPLLFRAPRLLPAPASPLSTLRQAPKPMTTTTATTMAVTTTLQPRRLASTSQQPPSPDAQRDIRATKEAASAAAAKLPPNAAPLDWNTFFQLRKTRRRVQLACSIAASAVSFGAGVVVLGSGNGDALVGLIPLDPFFSLGLITMACGALGWLVGPFAGSALFNAAKSKYAVQMRIKEGQFFARVKRNRVDPSASSAGNPVPDYYGEKISSVAGYRQWLKDQRAFRKKRTTFV